MIIAGFFCQTRQKQARTKSAELLKNDLEKERKPGCTDYLVKVSEKNPSTLFSI